MSDDIYRCPDCGRPFDLRDKLVDFAIASHEKDHQARHSTPQSLLSRGVDGVWRCKVCAHPFGKSEEMAGLAVISHGAEHGVTPVRPGAPGRTGTGSLGDAARALGRGLGKVIDALLD